MIRINPQAEPADFHEKVRRKGAAFLSGITPAEDVPIAGFAKHDYWKMALPDLHAAYSGICAYLGIHLEWAQGGVTVDHFRPKSKYPDLAYEWSNFRLAAMRINSRKGNYENVLDPFEIQNGWFQIEFVTGSIIPDPDLDAATIEKVQRTIDRLKLDEPNLRKMRTRRYNQFMEGVITHECLQQEFPFIFLELKRQGLL